jgi:hypothetical protein
LLYRLFAVSLVTSVGKAGLLQLQEIQERIKVFEKIATMFSKGCFVTVEIIRTYFDACGFFDFWVFLVVHHIGDSIPLHLTR